MDIANTTKDHPVWNVYNAYRTARLNVKYYENQLQRLKRRNFCIECLLAVFASSGVAGLWLWENTAGGFIWKGLGTLAAFLAVLKPLLNLTEKIKVKSEILVGYRTLDHKLQKLVININQHETYDDELHQQFMALLDTKEYLIMGEPNESIDEKLRNRCQDQVMVELPLEDFYIPKN